MCGSTIRKLRRAERNKVQIREADRYYIGTPPANEYLLEFLDAE